MTKAMNDMSAVWAKHNLRKRVNFVVEFHRFRMFVVSSRLLNGPLFLVLVSSVQTVHICTRWAAGELL